LSRLSNTASSRPRSWIARAIRKRYFARSRPSPDAVSGASRCLDRVGHVSEAGLGDLGQWFLGRRVDRLDRLAPAGAEIAVDEDAVGLAQVGDRGRLRRRRVLENAHVLTDM
jgi:hypothetical protein